MPHGNVIVIISGGVFDGYRTIIDMEGVFNIDTLITRVKSSLEQIIRVHNFRHLLEELQDANEFHLHGQFLDMFNQIQREGRARSETLYLCC